MYTDCNECNNSTPIFVFLVLETVGKDNQNFDLLFFRVTTPFFTVIIVILTPFFSDLFIIVTILLLSIASTSHYVSLQNNLSPVLENLFVFYTFFSFCLENRPD